MGANATVDVVHGHDSKQPTASSTGGRIRAHSTYILYSLLCAISILHLVNTFGRDYNPYPVPGHFNDAGASFDWEILKPSPELEWHDCFPNRQCARLEVPLDYSNPTGEKAAIALIRIKAKVSSNSSNYRGPILFNPGGPGGPGVTMIDQLGEFFQKLLGDEYDIIGFDPRGVGLTTPHVSSFSDPYERAYWNLGTPPLVNSTSDAFTHAYVRSELFGDLSMKRTSHAAEYVSTANVARDMLSITKAHGRDKLLYWGFSYGTVLGATYASLFPDNIERLVIDAVVDFDDYYSGNLVRNLFDTDKILQFFYDECSAAGTACPLHANSSILVQRRVESIFASIKSSPLPVLDDTGSHYGLVDYSMVKNDLFRTLYKPFSLIPEYAHILAALEEGDGRPALLHWQKSQLQPKCNSPPSPSPGGGEAALAIRCGEGPVASRNLADAIRHFEDLSKISVFADVWTQLTHIDCIGWKVKVKGRYGGPFNTTTRFPMLIIGNTYDPVTPLMGAVKAANGFSGSSLLTVNTPGHCSLTATSPSAMRYIRRYFREGILPPAGTVCEVEDKLYGLPKQDFQPLTTEDQDVLDATRLLSQHFHKSREGYLL